MSGRLDATAFQSVSILSSAVLDCAVFFAKADRFVDEIFIRAGYQDVFDRVVERHHSPYKCLGIGLHFIVALGNQEIIFGMISSIMLFAILPVFNLAPAMMSNPCFLGCSFYVDHLSVVFHLVGDLST